MTKKKTIGIICGCAAFVVIAIVLFLLFGRSDELTATTMRIMNFTGDVTLEENGKIAKLRKEMLMRSGNSLATENESFVDLNLDEKKAVGLDQQSHALFDKDGKKLHIRLDEGGLYFFTTGKLADDESFDIETQTMMVGIRGTSAYISSAEDEDSVVLTEGHLELEITDKATGESAGISLDAGCTWQYL